MSKILLGIINLNDYIQKNDPKKIAVLMACETDNPQILTEYAQWVCEEIGADFKAAMGGDAETFYKNCKFHIDNQTFQKKLKRSSHFNGFFHSSVVHIERNTFYKKRGDKDFFILFEYVSDFGYSLVACDAAKAKQIFGKIIYAERPIFDVELEIDY